MDRNLLGMRENPRGGDLGPSPGRVCLAFLRLLRDRMVWSPDRLFARNSPVQAACQGHYDHELDRSGVPGSWKVSNLEATRLIPC